MNRSTELLEMLTPQHVKRREMNEYSPQLQAVYNHIRQLRKKVLETNLQIKNLQEQAQMIKEKQAAERLKKNRAKRT